MNRTIFLIDGFNLYHSLDQAQHDSGQSTKWLDLSGLCASYLFLVSQRVMSRTILAGVHYFSAPPAHRSRASQDRHALYMRCLKSSGIVIHLGRFKEKQVTCSRCGGSFLRHEEKETDVAIATQLFELCHANLADSIVLVTGDTDLAPAVRLCQRLFPEKYICFAFPYKRTNTELQQMFPGSFKISQASYCRFQYPNPFRLADGKDVAKPVHW